MVNGLWSMWSVWSVWSECGPSVVNVVICGPLWSFVVRCGQCGQCGQYIVVNVVNAVILWSMQSLWSGLIKVMSSTVVAVEQTVNEITS